MVVKLVYTFVQGLAYTSVTECHSREHWNNLFWLVHDISNTKGTCKYNEHGPVFVKDLEFKTIFFAMNWKTLSSL